MPLATNYILVEIVIVDKKTVREEKYISLPHSKKQPIGQSTVISG
jgi:hypothetical protein